MTPFEQAKSRGDTRGQHMASEEARRATLKALLTLVGPTRRKRLRLAMVAGEAARKARA